MLRTRIRFWPAMDVGVALLLTLSVTLASDLPRWGTVLLVAALAVPLALNQRFPRTALVAAFAILLWTPSASAPALYTALRVGQRGLRPSPALILSGAAMLAAGTALVLAGAAHFNAIAQIPLTILLPLAAGAGWRRYRELQERARLGALEETRRRERARIAHDMHDSLGHELGLIALRAGALQVRTDLTPEQVRSAAAELRQGAATAAERLREVVTVLREESEVDGGEAADVEVLVRRSAEAGMRVTLDATGTDAPPLVRSTVSRVVREALTNAAKHAPGSSVTVRVTSSETETEVLVANGEPPGAGAAAPGSGVGLEALGERLRLVGGRFRAGPDEGGGFSVAAAVPHRSIPPAVRAADGGPVEERPGAPTSGGSGEPAAGEPAAPAAGGLTPSQGSEAAEPLAPLPPERVREAERSLVRDLVRTSVTLVALSAALYSLSSLLGW
ncbi:sensor histidine kinase [Nocardiopsis ganjiahuensis]|uniref:sensor histidine kinase n=1 Tax=Nocardiopsis ganjiahuensis TaxID=239984 RepID=UPI000346427C|nr:histidine kinase [Nocardiopsis ganjiahuensis]